MPAQGRRTRFKTKNLVHTRFFRFFTSLGSKELDFFYPNTHWTHTLYMCSREDQTHRTIDTKSQSSHHDTTVLNSTSTKNQKFDR